MRMAWPIAWMPSAAATGARTCWPSCTTRAWAPFGAIAIVMALLLKWQLLLATGDGGRAGRAAGGAGGRPWREPGDGHLLPRHARLCARRGQGQAGGAAAGRGRAAVRAGLRAWRRWCCSGRCSRAWPSSCWWGCARRWARTSCAGWAAIPAIASAWRSNAVNCRSTSWRPHGRGPDPPRPAGSGAGHLLRRAGPCAGAARLAARRADRRHAGRPAAGPHPDQPGGPRARHGAGAGPTASTPASIWKSNRACASWTSASGKGGSGRPSTAPISTTGRPNLMAARPARRRSAAQVMARVVDWAGSLPGAEGARRLPVGGDPRRPHPHAGRALAGPALARTLGWELGFGATCRFHLEGADGRGARLGWWDRLPN